MITTFSNLKQSNQTMRLELPEMESLICCMTVLAMSTMCYSLMVPLLTLQLIMCSRWTRLRLFLSTSYWFSLLTISDSSDSSRQDMMRSSFDDSSSSWSALLLWLPRPRTMALRICCCRASYSLRVLGQSYISSSTQCLASSLRLRRAVGLGMRFRCCSRFQDWMDLAHQWGCRAFNAIFGIRRGILQYYNDHTQKYTRRHERPCSAVHPLLPGCLPAGLDLHKVVHLLQLMELVLNLHELVHQSTIHLSLHPLVDSDSVEFAQPVLQLLHACLVLLAVEFLGLVLELQLSELVRNERVMLPQQSHLLFALLPQQRLLAHGLLVHFYLFLHVLEAWQSGLVLQGLLLHQLQCQLQVGSFRLELRLFQLHFVLQMIVGFLQLSIPPVDLVQLLHNPLPFPLFITVADAALSQ